MREVEMTISKQLEDTVFFAALHVTDPDERRIFLERVCIDNAELRTVVEEMLATLEESDRLVDRGYLAIASNVEILSETGISMNRDPGVLDEKTGKSIGRYTILEKLGEGGGGVVYLAAQDDPVKRIVALKIIKLGMDTRSVITRFEVERQALAMMDHPNIARVLDAGATDAGRPYFVLEFVRGTKITDYCNENRCDLRQRLELFIQVCRAIQHAHQKGVIHRDIKPSNVLVAMHDGIPLPKVIDFGIAKAIEGRLGDETQHTLHEQLLGTPAYMSPEQAAQGRMDVDTRTDVYSLGVLLFELLTGGTPFDKTTLSTAGPEEIRRILREHEPRPPSSLLNSLRPEILRTIAMARGSEPTRLLSRVRGDLDWITLKAIEKDRARRYDTVNGLAMDVRRFLDGEPVTARPPGRIYLLEKLLRRHAVFFGAGSAVMLSLAGGMGISIWQYFKVRSAEKRQSELREIAEYSRANEEMMRKDAEAREKLTEAVILLRQGDYSGAAKMLDAIEARPRRPSLDGVTALRSVGEWLALQGRWREASERYLWLLEIDKLDPWGPVTLDTQACGVVLVENGDRLKYRQFCEEAIHAHAASDNGDAVGRVLKTCLLTPPDQALWQRLKPLGYTVEKWFQTLGDGGTSQWAAIPVCLWAYRGGDYKKAMEIAQPFSAYPVGNNALVPTVQIIFSMTLWQRGEGDEARRQLTRARDAINLYFAEKMTVGDTSRGLWYDWVFAKIMLEEATILIGKSS